MKKIFLPITILLLFCNPVFAQHEPDSTFLIKHSKWIAENHLYIEFLSESDYIISYLKGEDHRFEYEITGKYSISGISIILEADLDSSKHAEIIPDYFKQKYVSLSFQDEPRSGFYTKKLITDKFPPFYSHSFKASVDTIREIDGYEVLLLKTIQGKTRFNSRVRTGPGIAYQTATLYYSPENDGKYEESSVLVKGWKLNALYRTTKKEKISDMNDFWYYCRFENMEPGPWNDVEGWIYGGLILFE